MFNHIKQDNHSAKIVINYQAVGVPGKINYTDTICESDLKSLGPVKLVSKHIEKIKSDLQKVGSEVIHISSALISDSTNTYTLYK